MTDAKPGSQAGSEAGQAMNEVLQAEREAAQAVAECELRAEQLLRAAQARAQRLVRRADQRITAIQMRCNHHADSMIRAMEKQRPEPDGATSLGQLSEREIEAVVAALAEDLTSHDEKMAGEP